mgnify:CR=1 FL=1
MIQPGRSLVSGVRVWLGSRLRGQSRDNEIRTGGPVHEQVTVNLHGREHDRERCRGEQDLAIEVEGLGRDVMRDYLL